jgi:hypothetical protein
LARRKSAVFCASTDFCWVMSRMVPTKANRLPRAIELDAAARGDPAHAAISCSGSGLGVVLPSRRRRRPVPRTISTTLLISRAEHRRGTAPIKLLISVGERLRWP